MPTKRKRLSGADAIVAAKEYLKVNEGEPLRRPILSQKTLADEYGIHKSMVSKALSLIKMDSPFVRFVEDGRMSMDSALKFHGYRYTAISEEPFLASSSHLAFLTKSELLTLRSIIDAAVEFNGR